VLLLHDVGWPYGRRDLYHAPERIPDQFRHPYAQKGLASGQSELRDEGGLNAQFHNAVFEGGSRNGVKTALEDFVAEHDRRMRVVELPVYFGLAVASDDHRLSRHPGLAEALDRIEGARGRYEQAELAESLRVGKAAESGSAAPSRLDRAARRYLDLVKRTLLNEPYLENEVRLEYLQRCIATGTPPDPLKLRDPRMWLPVDVRRLQQTRQTGAAVRTLAGRALFPYTTVGRSGLDHLQECLETIRRESTSGDLAACGVWRGGTAIFMRAFLEAYDVEERLVWVADRFSGVPESPDTTDPSAKPRRFPELVGDLNQVRHGLDRFGLFDERVRFLQGSFADTLADAPIGELALLHLGDDLEETAAEALERLYDRLVPGGFVVVEHYDAPGCRRAVDQFRAKRGIQGPVTRADWTGASWRKVDSGTRRVSMAQPTPRQLNRAPLAEPAAEPGVELSVVVVVYDMQREAARTLRSLTRSYQQGVEDLDYEVIVVENGSSDEQKLGEDLVRGFGPEFRYLDLDGDSTPSPAHAVNRGTAIARGEALALMIDGAHVLSPGVLRFGMLGLRTYAPAIATTHQLYLGPGQQGEAIDRGYDQEYEDQLLDKIHWPVDGYRLFEIANFIGDRDWFDGLWESNCLFTPRALLEQVGGVDETFSMPGGGYANLDLFERLAATPGVTLVGILGEGSFHQVHGGTTTNQPDSAERHARLMSYRVHYENVRKRPFRGPGKPHHYVGKVTGPALRTRPRWMTGQAFREAQRLGADGVPAHPTPIPEQLQAQFTDAFWRSLAWRDTAWLGQRVERTPTDLVVYQELVARVRPDWIVEMRATNGGGAIFFASICDLVGTGQVLSLVTDPDGERPEHPRITYVTGVPTEEETRRRVFETVGETSNALVLIPAAPLRTILAEFKRYAPLVGVGSYVIFEGTIVNGHPVLPGYGPGPFEAIQEILKHRRDFAPDHRPERFGLTFNPRGFLRRVE
jgi:cephalosporin hydroxylase